MVQKYLILVKDAEQDSIERLFTRFYESVFPVARSKILSKDDKQEACG